MIYAANAKTPNKTIIQKFFRSSGVLRIHLGVLLLFSFAIVLVFAAKILF